MKPILNLRRVAGYATAARMRRNIVVYDIETKYAFDEVGGREKLSSLGISVLGAYDYLTEEYVIFEEKELSKFEERLGSGPLLVGFNNKRFDTPILQCYCQQNLSLLPQLDIMEELTKNLGHRVSLDSVAKATLNSQKSGNGLDAIRYYRNGEVENLKKYCLDDVKLTKEIYEYGAEHQELYFTNKYDGSKRRCLVSWEIKNPRDDGPQMDIFR